MKILVTGGAGYLGSVLIPKLLVRGHSVRIVDVGYFGLGHLRGLRPAVEIVREDLRTMAVRPELLDQLLSGCDCVIHLAAISNDPSAELNPELTSEVNVDVTRILAEAARFRRIKFLFSSSCSVYGEAEGDIEESGALNPLTTYAVTKVKAEETLVQLRDDSWSPIILRNGTLFGYSPRMRFDLVVNIFSLYSTLYNEIKVFGDGLHWRPFLHVGDAARAMIYFAEKSELGYVCYNISHENLRVVDLAQMFKVINPGLHVTHVNAEDIDQRNYRVSSHRMFHEGFRTRTGLPQGAEEMVEAIVNGLIPDPESIYYRNAKWLNELTHIGSKDHREIANLMETMAQVRPRT